MKTGCSPVERLSQNLNRMGTNIMISTQYSNILVTLRPWIELFCTAIISPRHLYSSLCAGQKKVWYNILPCWCKQSSWDFAWSARNSSCSMDRPSFHPWPILWQTTLVSPSSSIWAWKNVEVQWDGQVGWVQQGETEAWTEDLVACKDGVWWWNVVTVTWWPHVSW